MIEDFLILVWTRCIIHSPGLSPPVLAPPAAPLARASPSFPFPHPPKHSTGNGQCMALPTQTYTIALIYKIVGGCFKWGCNQNLESIFNSHLKLYSSFILVMSPSFDHHMYHVKHKVKGIMNLNITRSWGKKGERFFRPLVKFWRFSTGNGRKEKEKEIIKKIKSPDLYTWFSLSSQKWSLKKIVLYFWFIGIFG